MEDSEELCRKVDDLEWENSELKRRLSCFENGKHAEDISRLNGQILALQNEILYLRSLNLEEHEAGERLEEENENLKIEIQMLSTKIRNSESAKIPNIPLPPPPPLLITNLHSGLPIPPPLPKFSVTNTISDKILCGDLKLKKTKNVNITSALRENALVQVKRPSGNEVNESNANTNITSSDTSSTKAVPNSLTKPTHVDTVQEMKSVLASLSRSKSGKVRPSAILKKQRHSTSSKIRKSVASNFDKDISDLKNNYIQEEAEMEKHDSVNEELEIAAAGFTERNVLTGSSSGTNEDSKVIPKTELIENSQIKDMYINKVSKDLYEGSINNARNDRSSHSELELNGSEKSCDEGTTYRTAVERGTNGSDRKEEHKIYNTDGENDEDFKCENERKNDYFRTCTNDETVQSCNERNLDSSKEGLNNFYFSDDNDNETECDVNNKKIDNNRCTSVSEHSDDEKLTYVYKMFEDESCEIVPVADFTNSDKTDLVFNLNNNFLNELDVSESLSSNSSDSLDCICFE